MHSSQLVVGGERDEFDGNARNGVPIRLEAVAQSIEVRQNVGI